MKSSNSLILGFRGTYIRFPECRMLIGGGGRLERGDERHTLLRWPSSIYFFSSDDDWRWIEAVAKAGEVIISHRTIGRWQRSWENKKTTQMQMDLRPSQLGSVYLVWKGMVSPKDSWCNEQYHHTHFISRIYCRNLFLFFFVLPHFTLSVLVLSFSLLLLKHRTISFQMWRVGKGFILATESSSCEVPEETDRDEWSDDHDSQLRMGWGDEEMRKRKKGRGE